jgi:hypothetical protein
VLHSLATPIHLLGVVHRVQPLCLHLICPSIFMHVVARVTKCIDSSSAAAAASVSWRGKHRPFVQCKSVSSTAVPSHTIPCVIRTATPPEPSFERTIAISRKAINQCPPFWHFMRRCEVPVTTFHRDDETISIEPPPSVYHVSDSCNVFASPINQGVYPAQAEHLQPTAADWGGGFESSCILLTT